VEVGANTTTTLTISNSGNSTLTWSGLSTGDGVFTPSATSGTVAAGGSANVTLTFTPSAATSYSSTLTVTSDATSGTNTTTVSGTGTAAPTRIIELSGDGNTSDLAFGGVEIGTSATRTLLIHNSGNSTLTVTGTSSSIPNTTFDQTSGTVAAGGTGSVTVTFTPLTTDLVTGTVTLTGDQTSGTNTIFGGGWGTETVPPDPTTYYYVWGGQNDSVFLGRFSCTFCTEYGSDSINNEYGNYGSIYSSSSMRNPYGTYGSEYSSYSPCNPYTSTAPGLYNEDGTTFLGVLGGTPYGSGYRADLADWVAGYICNN
jgi:hypothetical protein